jgi:beta-glucanase (GH16 family)
MTRFAAVWAFMLPIFILGFTVSCQAGGDQTNSKSNIPAGYILVWADEFDTPGLPDTKKWVFDTHANSKLWWHNERQFYTENRTENARVEGGHLIIEVRKETLPSVKGWVGQEYTSAKLLTKGRQSWTYGFFDVRAKLACGRGVWPAIWMMSDSGIWPRDGEIDIMEQVGHEPGRIHATLHTSSSEPMNGISMVSDTCGSYHNYQMDWRRESMTFFIDGHEIYHIEKGSRKYDSWPFDHKFHMILNVAVGGAWGAQKGIDPSAFPTEMDVEYVRVYQNR